MKNADDAKYMIDLPNPYTPGSYVSEGPMTEEEAREYLGLWGLHDHWLLFATKLAQSST